MLQRFRWLKGQWRIERKIISNNKLYSIVRGEAQFSEEDSEHLYYREIGLMELVTGASFSVHQEYKYYYNKGENIIEKQFANPERPFYSLHFFNKTFAAQASHLCGEDRYDAEYQFANMDEKGKEFTLTYTVCGPHKNYISTTIYQFVQ